MKGLRIECILPGSIAAEFEVEPGDCLLRINGHGVRDLIDYSYYTASEQYLLLEILKACGELWELEVERENNQPLGFIFTAPQPAKCRNNCIFCFVHQLPRGLRKPLYVKDEDYRLSFLNGNYVTLANLKAHELKRIIEQRLSPLYISVHTTNPLLREQMLAKQGIPPILEQLQMLANAQIRLHTQIVLCPGINDGTELLQTVTDLAALHPAVQSVAIVPLGLTAHRNRLPQLAAVDADYARQFIVEWDQRAKELAQKLGEPFLFLADEFYLKAGHAFPPLRDYGDLPQLENGVGMLPLFMHDARTTLRSARPIGQHKCTVITGNSAFPVVADFLAKLSAKTGVDISVLAIENRLFGSSVTVTGLIPGNDIIAALQGGEPGEVLLIPDVMVKEGEGIFLDDISLEELGTFLRCRVMLFEATPQGCYQTLRKIFTSPVFPS